MSSIAAGTSTGTALVSSGDTTGNLVLQVNGTTPSLTLNAAGAHGVGSSPSYGTAGQVLTSAGSAATPTWVSAGDATANLGYLNIPQNSQSAAYTLVIGDAGKTIYHPTTDANARTFTIPANGTVAFPIGTVVNFVNMTTQVVTIAITTDTMYLGGTGTTGSRSLALYGVATALKMTATTWIITGTGLT